MNRRDLCFSERAALAMRMKKKTVNGRFIIVGRARAREREVLAGHYSFRMRIPREMPRLISLRERLRPSIGLLNAGLFQSPATPSLHPSRAADFVKRANGVALKSVRTCFRVASELRFAETILQSLGRKIKGLRRGTARFSPGSEAARSCYARINSV